MKTGNRLDYDSPLYADLSGDFLTEEGEETTIYSLEDENDYVGYVLEEEEDADFTEEMVEGVNYAQSPQALADEADMDIKSAASGKRQSCISLMLKVMISPVEGWKKLRRTNITPDKFALECFYPLLAFTALTHLFSFIFEAYQTPGEIIVRCIISFISYFFGFFLVFPIGQIVFPKVLKESIRSDFGKIYVMLSMSTLALFTGIMNIIPMLGPVLVFLPIWTVYIIYRGIRFLKVPESQRASAVTWLSVLVIGLPLGWNWVFTELLPLANL